MAGVAARAQAGVGALTAGSGSLVTPIWKCRWAWWASRPPEPNGMEVLWSGFMMLPPLPIALIGFTTGGPAAKAPWEVSWERSW